jgi:hypothetical protein
VNDRDPKPGCVACGRGSADVPLLSFEYRGGSHSICPQHLPVLIHDPAQLTGKLAGAENLKPADHQD